MPERLKTAAGPQEARTGYWELVRGNASFRYLWFGQIVSLLGDWFNLIASAALLAQLTGSGFAIGGLFAVRMLAPFLISPLAGVIADRCNRKYILILSDLFRAVTVLGFLLVREPQDVWMLYALTAIQLALGGFFFPARNAILPDIVSARELGTANAINATTWSVMLAFGAALGGLAAGIWGIYPAFIIDAVSFVVSAVILLGVKYRKTPDTAASGRGLFETAVVQYLEGLGYLRNNRDILVTALHKGVTALVFSQGYQVVKVVIGRSLFPLGEAGGISLGLLFSAAGLGTGIGPIAARLWTADRPDRLRLALFVGYFLCALGLGISSLLINLETVLLGSLWAGIGGGIIWVFSTQLLLQSVPGQVRGRVFATEYAIFTLLSTFGVTAIGFALDSSLKVSEILAGMCALTLVPGGLWRIWLWRRARR
ncbi:MAG: MFS transporter [Candidatus Aminicenantes bacterium]|nr:MFS transporter [Candidatus Aminicenantes bacterium]